MTNWPPRLPLGDEYGRLLTHGTLAPHYLCRHCAAPLLAIVPSGILACTRCDLPYLQLGYAA